MTKKEHVAYFNPQEGGFYWAKPTKVEAPVSVNVEPLPLYTTPQQGCAECGVGGGYALYCLPCVEKFVGNKEWVGLTTNQMMAIAEWQISAHRPLIDVIKAVEQALKEKNI